MVHGSTEPGGPLLKDLDPLEILTKRREHRSTRGARRVGGGVRRPEGAEEPSLRPDREEERKHSRLSGQDGEELVGSGVTVRRTRHENDLIRGPSPKRREAGRVEERAVGNPTLGEHLPLREGQPEGTD